MITCGTQVVSGSSGGGGASLPATPADALLDAGAPQSLVVLDDDGEGTALPIEDVALTMAALVTANRRPALPGTTALHWPCNERTGSTLANDGTTSSANLAVQSGGLVAQRRAGSDAPRGLGCLGSAAPAYGAAGIAVGDGSALTAWAVVTLDSLSSSRQILVRHHGAPGAGWTAPYCCAMIVTGSTPGQWRIAINVGGTYRDLLITDAAAQLRAGVEHLVGLTWDGHTLTAWLDGVSAGTSTPGDGNIDWNVADGGRWYLGAREGAEYLGGLIADAGAVAAVWNAATWLAVYDRWRGWRS